MTSVWRLPREALAGKWNVVAALAGWSVVETLPTLLSGVLIAHALDDGFLSGNLVQGMAWLAPVAVAMAVGAWGTRRCCERSGELVEPVRDHLVRYLVSATLANGADADGPQHGRVISRLTDQVEMIRETIATVLSVLRRFGFTVASVLVGALSLVPSIASLIVGPLAVSLLIFGSTLRSLARRQRAALAADEDVAELHTSLVGGLRDIAAAGAESLMIGRFRMASAAQVQATCALTRAVAIRTLVLGVGAWLPFVLVIADSPMLRAHGATAGAIIGSLTYLITGLQPAVQSVVRGIGTAATQLTVTLRWMTERTGRRPASVESSHGSTPRPALTHELVLRQVGFCYGADAEPIVRALDLRITENDVLAIVGPSGIGKSTLANILSGITAAQTGQVRLGGVELDRLDGAELARQRVLIPQESYVFRGTLRENLAYLAPDCGNAELTRALAVFGLNDLAERLGGLSGEVVREALSAGERQLLALARAYLSPAWLTILDEATSHLDPATEAMAEEIFRCRPGALVIVAHRMSSALRARRILVMDGTEVRQGTHATLLANSALYRDLAGRWGVDHHQAEVAG